MESQWGSVGENHENVTVPAGPVRPVLVRPTHVWLKLRCMLRSPAGRQRQSWCKPLYPVAMTRSSALVSSPICTAWPTVTQLRRLNRERRRAGG